MTTNSHTPLPFGGPLTAAAMEAPLGQLDAAIATVIATGSGASTTLTAQANAGQASLTVAASAGFAPGDPIYIGTGATFESRIVNTVPGGGVTITVTVNLTNTYAIGKPVSKSPVELVDARGSYTTLGGRVGNIESRVFDTRRYGSVGDNATDDRAAIQAANDAAVAAGGGTVLVPAKSHVVGATLVLGANVSLAGAGDGSILRFTGTNGASPQLIRIDGAHATVRDLALTDSRSYAANPISSLGVSVYANYTSIERCWISGFKGGGITAGDVTDLLVRGNRIDTIGQYLALVGDGVLVMPSATGATRVVISDNIIRAVGKHGINLASAGGFSVRQFSVTGNVCVDNGDTGILADTGIGGAISGNTCVNNGLAMPAGAATGGQGIQISRSTDIAIAGNTCTGNTENGINVDLTSTRVTISGNVSRGNGYTGINVSELATVISITGNIVSGNTLDGIALTAGVSGGPAHVVISGNTVELNGQTGIVLSGTPVGANVTITGNLVHDNNRNGSARSGISVESGYQDVAITGNISHSVLTPLQLWGIRFYAGDRVLIVGNQARGNTNQIGATPETGGSTNYLVANNLTT